MSSSSSLGSALAAAWSKQSRAVLIQLISCKLFPSAKHGHKILTGGLSPGPKTIAVTFKYPWGKTEIKLILLRILHVKDFHWVITPLRVEVSGLSKVTFIKLFLKAVSWYHFRLVLTAVDPPEPRALAFFDLFASASFPEGWSKTKTKW